MQEKGDFGMNKDWIVDLSEYESSMIKVPKTYKVDVDKIKTISDVKELIEILNIQVSEYLINDKNKYLFKEIE